MSRLESCGLGYDRDYADNYYFRVSRGLRSRLASDTCILTDDATMMAVFLTMDSGFLQTTQYVRVEVSRYWKCIPCIGLL
jgi:hypothetical protein